jgi:hypothetical protein
LQFDTALLYWGEGDGRVMDLSVTAAVKRALDEDRSFTLNVTFDTLTGASPSCVVPSGAVQSFTRPSGEGSYRIAAGDTPLDDSFKDARVALSAAWRQSLDDSMRWEAGASASHEYGYQHLGLNARLERDFNLCNTTVYLGAAYGKDDLKPVGGAPVGLSAMRGTSDGRNKLAGDLRSTTPGTRRACSPPGARNSTGCCATAGCSAAASGARRTANRSASSRATCTSVARWTGTPSSRSASPR